MSTPREASGAWSGDRGFRSPLLRRSRDQEQKTNCFLRPPDLFLSSRSRVPYLALNHPDARSPGAWVATCPTRALPLAMLFRFRLLRLRCTPPGVRVVCSLVVITIAIEVALPVKR